MARPKLSPFYKAYIKSAAWKARSEACIARAGFRCQACGKARKDGVTLQAHHLTYIRLGKEQPSDLMCLCKSCHPSADTQRRRTSALWRRRFR